MSAQLTIVIPTFNHCAMLGDCLASLGEQTYTDFEVIVVDDGSSEDVATFVSSAFPEGRVVRLPENRGFAAAVNAGLREVSTPFLMLLNNDMTLDSSCLRILMDALESAVVDMVAPLVLWKDEPELIYSAGDLLRVNGRPESIGFRCPRKDFVAPETVFGVSAGAAIYRKAVIDTVGMLDEKFVAYFEDGDLNFRARLAGFKALCVPEADAYHVGSGSLGGRLWWRSRQCYRNHALLVIKNMPASLLVRYAPAILAERLHQTHRLFTSARNEFGAIGALQVWAGTAFEILRYIPHALRERGRIRRLKTIADKDLDNLLTR